MAEREIWELSGRACLGKILGEAEMHYNSLLFAGFLLLFLGVYFLLRGNRGRKWWILTGNLVFYAWSGPGALLIVAATAAVVYAATRGMSRVYGEFEEVRRQYTPREQTRLLAGYKKKTRWMAWGAVAVICAVWAGVKLGKLLGPPQAATLGAWRRDGGILVPLGISYYSLSAIGYLFDVYWQKTKAEKSFPALFTVMTYFPHIVQGPIGKYSRLLPQFAALPDFSGSRVCFGLQRMLWGYMKKLLVADRLAMYTAAVFALPEKFAGVEIALAVGLSAVQLYADFSGCMDIVGGISQCIGVELDENFRQPFFARSAREFWSRWHITLGAWTREYIYLPIALHPGFLRRLRGLKGRGHARLAGFWKGFCPLLAVWLTTGLWHGTGADYLVWGLYWCAVMTLSQEGKGLWARMNEGLGVDAQSRLFRAWQRARTFALFAIGRMFTVTGSLAGCGTLWRNLLTQRRLWTLWNGSLFRHGLGRQDFSVALLGMLLMLAVDICHEKGIRLRERIAALPLPLRWAVYLGAVLALAVLGVYGPGYDASAFAYGGF